MDFLLLTSPALSGGSMMSVLLMAVGFGLVIFVHELGHFLAAKLVNIRVEQFAIGFGRKLAGFTWGETEYRINVLPLGGYVKMPGQEDFELQSEDNPDLADPRSFNNRPIWARMIVVSAGVVMNVILAAILFMVIFSVGRVYMPTRVGGVRAGYPAESARIEALDSTGLQAGDLIEAVDGKEVYSFDKIQVRAMLSDDEDRHVFRVRRPGVDKPFTVEMGVAPQMSSRGVGRIFGITPSLSPTLADDPASAAYLEAVTGGALHGGETIVSLKGEPVEHGWEIDRIDGHLASGPVELVAVDAEGQRVSARIDTVMGWSSAVVRRAVEAGLAAKVTPPFNPEPLNIAGLQPRVLVDAPNGADSPAARAGLQRGDVITAFGPAYEPVSIPRLQELCRQEAGKSTELRVERDGQPSSEITKIDVGSLNGQPMIGVIILPEKARAVVGAVNADSPFAGEVLPGDRIVAVNGQPVVGWPEVIDALAALEPDGVVELLCQTPAGGEKTTAPVPAAEAKVDRADYAYSLPPSLPLTMLTAVRKSSNPWEAVRWGAEATGDFIVMTYATLKGFFTGQISGKEFSGPIGIFRLGVTAGQDGLMRLLWLLAIISANLAVINFLPLPIVDGGLAIMLLIEKARGKPLSLKVQNAIQIVGLIFIGLAFVLLTYNDIRQWITSKW